jgi:uncharacterized membrane protein
MTRQEIKAHAKQQLGNNIFGSTWLLSILVVVIVAAISSVAGSIIPGIGAMVVLGPLGYGAAYVFLNQARTNGQINIADVFNGFTKDFVQNFLIGFLSNLFIALWSLLFCIPGIIKSYSYAMAYYIKIDHPEYDWKACITESRRIMNGHKMDLFIQDLSFIGWLIVGSFCCGIGTLWVMPYQSASRAQFYESVKDNANTVVGF